MSLWDESRLAVNAFEMCENGNWIVTHYDGKPDMWNTKPPFVIWWQAISMKILGYNLLAHRLPSAIAGFGTILLVFFFCKKKLDNERLGYFSALVLLTSSGYVTDHVTRTGDYDAMLTLISTLAVALVFSYSNSLINKNRTQLLYAIGLCFGIAVLTKSIAGLFSLPGLFIFLLWKKEVIALLRDKHFYGATVLFLGIVAGYYLLREHYNVGYLEAVWNNEIGGRYFLVNENNSKEFSFYFRKMYESKFTPWLYFIPLSLLVATKEDEKIKDAIVLLSAVVVVFLLIISISKTKLIWYDAPVYPLLAIIVGLSIDKLYQGFKALFLESNLNTSVLTFFFVFCLFGFSYQQRVNQSYWVSKLLTVPEHKLYKSFMDQLPEYKKYTIYIPTYNAPVLFYQKVFSKKGYDIEIKQLIPFLPDGPIVEQELGTEGLSFAKDEVVMICQTPLKKDFKEKYVNTVLQQWKSCELIKVLDENK